MKATKKKHQALIETALTVVQILDVLRPQIQERASRTVVDYLRFEERLNSMTLAERRHMMDLGLSDAAQARLDAARVKTNSAEFEDLVDMYARSAYMRRCDWLDWLLGSNKKKPDISGWSKKVA